MNVLLIYSCCTEHKPLCRWIWISYNVTIPNTDHSGSIEAAGHCTIMNSFTILIEIKIFFLQAIGNMDMS